jgi:hypothetical protein
MLSATAISDTALGCAVQPCLKSGYNFNMDADPGPGPGGYQPHWNLTATTSVATGINATGARSFYTNEVGVIYYQLGGTAPGAGITQYVRVPTDGLQLGN